MPYNPNIHFPRISNFVTHIFRSTQIIWDSCYGYAKFINSSYLVGINLVLYHHIMPITFWIVTSKCNYLFIEAPRFCWNSFRNSNSNCIQKRLVRRFAHHKIINRCCIFGQRYDICRMPTYKSSYRYPEDRRRTMRAQTQ